MCQEEYTAYHRAQVKQARFQFFVGLLILAILLAVGTHVESCDANLMEKGQYKYTHMIPVVVKYMRHIRVHRELFRPRPRRKDVPVYCCKDDIVDSLLLSSMWFATCITSLPQMSATNHIAVLSFVAELYVICVALHLTRIHGMMWATLLAMLLVIGGVESNPGPTADYTFGSLQLRSLASEMLSQLTYVDRFNCQNRWEACEFNMQKVRESAHLGQLDMVKVACYACNSCTNDTLLCRMEHLLACSDEWLTCVASAAISYGTCGPANVLQTPIDVSSSPIFLRMTQSLLSVWERVGTSYIDTSCVAAMLRYDLRGQTNVHICYPQ